MVFVCFDAKSTGQDLTGSDLLEAPHSQTQPLVLAFAEVLPKMTGQAYPPSELMKKYGKQTSFRLSIEPAAY
jgi:hypothetical protein